MAAKTRSRRSGGPASKSKRKASDVEDNVLGVCTQTANTNPSETDKYRSTMAEVLMCAAHEPLIPTRAAPAQQTADSQLPPHNPPPSYSEVYNFLSSLMGDKEPPPLSEASLSLVTKMYDDLLARVQAAAPSLSRQVGLLKKTKCKQRGGKKAGPAGKGKGRQQKKQCPAKDVFLNAETVNPLNVPSDLMNFNCY